MTIQGSPCWSIHAAQSPVVDANGPRCTNMYETRNETNRRPITYGERPVQTA
jgi:hypothetical protein